MPSSSTHLPLIRCRSVGVEIGAEFQLAPPVASVQVGRCLRLVPNSGVVRCRDPTRTSCCVDAGGSELGSVLTPVLFGAGFYGVPALTALGRGL